MRGRCLGSVPGPCHYREVKKMTREGDGRNTGLRPEVWLCQFTCHVFHVLRNCGSDNLPLKPFMEDNICGNALKNFNVS